MSLVLQSTGGGSITINEPTTASNFTQTLPASTGTILTTGTPQSGGVIQVVSTNKTDTFTSSTTGTYTDITNMSVSITPKFSTSKILVIFSGVCAGQSAVSGSHLRLVRGSTAIDIGDSAGSRVPATTNAYQADANQSVPVSLNYLDSPATTSATTYKIQFITGSGTFYFNRSQNDTDNNGFFRYASTITVMEIAA